MSNPTKVDIVVGGVHCTGTAENDHYVIPAGINVAPGRTILVGGTPCEVSSATHVCVDNLEQCINVYVNPIVL